MRFSGAMTDETRAAAARPCRRTRVRPRGPLLLLALGLVALAAPAVGRASPGAVHFRGLGPYAAGSHPSIVAVRDLNGDGHPDLAVADYRSNTVSILLGNGDGTFAAATTVTVGSSPSSVILVDLNGDGHPDLVTSNYTSPGSVSVLLGNGDGTFGTKTDLAVGNEPNSVAAGDLNGDGKLDLVTADYAGDTISVLLGNGDGTFGAAAATAAGSGPNWAALGDLNGDGHLDVAVADRHDDTVGVLLGNGDGTFAPVVAYGLGAGTQLPFTLSIGDLNGDKHLDLAVGDSTSHDVTVLLGNGDGTFPSTPTGSYAVGGDPQSIAIGDLNGDGNADLVAAATGGGASLLLGNGDGSFASATALSAGTTPDSAAIADLNGDSAKDVVIGNYGSSDVSVLLADVVPGAPTGVSASPASGQATVSFTAPANDGGATISSYTVTASPGGATASGSSSPIVVTGLTNGTGYTFTVTATNVAGTGAASAASAAVSPLTTPAAPGDVSAKAGNGSAVVSFSPGSDGGSAVTHYTVVASPGGASTSGSGSPISIGGLDNGTAYTFTVTATNAAGTSPASAASAAVTPITVPGAPTDVSAVAGDGQAEVAFAAPGDEGGAAVESYTATASPGGATATGPAGPIVVTGLDNGTAYTFTVTAANAAGTGAASQASEPVTPVTVPGAPTDVSAVAGDGQAEVAFTAPGDDGGAAIESYTATASPGGATATGPAGPIVVTGLDNGTAYTFTVTAANAAGTGAASQASEPVTPVTVPGAPTGVVARPGRERATVSFVPPSDDGGTPVLGYTVTASPGGATATGTGSPLTVKGLAAGKAYTFTVTAANAVGTGPASAASSRVATAAPSPPVPAQVRAQASAPTPPTPSATTTTTAQPSTVAAVPSATTTIAAQPPTAPPPPTTTTTAAETTTAATTTQEKPTPPPPAGSTPAASPPGASAPPAVHLALSSSVETSGSDVTVSGAGLEPGSTVTIVLHSQPVELARFAVGASGSFRKTVILPGGVAAGAHRIVVSATAADGSPLTRDAAFTLAPPALKPYSPKHDPKRVVATFAAGFALLSVAGAAGGLAAAAGGGSGAGRRERRRASVTSAATFHHTFRWEGAAPGDRSWTWRLPGYRVVDRLSRSLPAALAPRSPLAARLVRDAVYLRAILGSASLAAPLAGLALGSLAAASNGGSALPPALGIVVALTALGVFDALAGVLGASAFAVGVIAQGALASTDSARTLLGVVSLWFVLPLIAAAFRPFRRPLERVGLRDAWWRAADLTIAALVAAWTAQKIVGSWLGLSGRDLPIVAHANTVALAVLAGIALRFAAETGAAVLYPERLQAVEPDELPAPPASQLLLGIAVRTAIFVFVALAFLGNCWELWAGAAVFMLPPLLEIRPGLLPNHARLRRVLPGGVTKTVAMLFVGQWYFVLFKEHVSAGHLLPYGFVLLSLPGLTLALLELVARDGSRNDDTGAHQLAGLALVVVGVLFVLGRLG